MRDDLTPGESPSGTRAPRPDLRGAFEANRTPAPPAPSPRPRNLTPAPEQRGPRDVRVRPPQNPQSRRGARRRGGLRLPAGRPLGQGLLVRLRLPGAGGGQGVDCPRRPAGHPGVHLRDQPAGVDHLRRRRHGDRGAAGGHLPDEHPRGVRLRHQPLWGPGAPGAEPGAADHPPGQARRDARPAPHRAHGEHPHRRLGSHDLGRVHRRRRRRRRRGGGGPTGRHRAP